MKTLRLFSYWVIGCLLGAWAVFAHAESIPWTVETSPKTTHYYAKNSGTVRTGSFTTTQAAGDAAIGMAGCTDCTYTSGAFNANCSGAPQVGYQIKAHKIRTSDGLPMSCQGVTLSGSSASMYSEVVCPAGYGWESTICKKYSCPSGFSIDQGMCVRDPTVCPSGYHPRTPDNGQCEQDCFGDQTQKPDGTCGCQAGNKSYFSGSHAATAQFQGSGDCYNGCTVKAGFVSFCAVPSLTNPCLTSATTDGSTCGGSMQSPVIKTTLAPPAPAPDPETPPEPGEPEPDPLETPENNNDPDACGAAGGVYYQSGGQSKCGTPGPDNSMDKMTSSKVTGTVTNPDGTQTITTETITTQTAPGGGTTTSKTTTVVTKDAGGNVTGEGTATETGTGLGDKSDGPGQCAKEPDSPMCKQGKVGKKGKFGNRDSEIEGAKAELLGYFNGVKTSVSSMFGTLNGSGALPCPAPVVVLGRPITFCFTDYSAQLSKIGAMVVLVASLLAAFIIFRR